MFGLSQTRMRTAPSQYPRLPFHVLRLTQLVSSIIVGAIMIYFIDILDREYDESTGKHWPVPWTFIFLLTACLLSVVALTFTMLMHCCVGLNPQLNLMINGALSALWGSTWAVLTWYMSGTLANRCSIELWAEEGGVMVCRIYKALFTFALLGFLSTVAALALDLYVRRRQTRSGIYRLHDLDNGQIRKTSEQIFPTGLQFAVGSHHNGYEVPEQQFKYDTAYIPGRD